MPKLDGEGLMVRGSLLRLRRKCGKSNCRCAEGELHASWVLSYSLKGRTRMLLIPEAELTGVRKALARYRQDLHSLNAAALNGIKSLRRGLRTKSRRLP